MQHPRTALSLPARHARQRGIALVIALVFLLSLTLIGIAALTSTSSEEKMNYAMADYTRAFQASDSGLTAAEDWIDKQPVQPIACSDSCSSSSLVWFYSNSAPQFSTSDLFSDSWWTANGLSFGTNYFQDGSSPTASSYLLRHTYSQPSYVVEQIGADQTSSLVVGQEPTYKRWYYRISARGTGAQSKMDAVSQSVYIHGF